MRLACDITVPSLSIRAIQMAISTTINLPKSHPARFPNRCVVCGHEGPTSRLRIITGTIGWWTWMLWIFGKPFFVKAPSCKWCAWKLHALRLLSVLLIFSVMAAVYYFVWPYVEQFVPRSIRRWAILGLFIVCMLPYFIFEAFFAKPFDVTAYNDSVDYDFTLPEYASEFAALNHNPGWVKVNGHKLWNPFSVER
jgi:hypothetical protein